MKKLAIILILLMFAIQANAAEMGFKAGMFQSYSGSTELFTGQKVSLEGANTPLSLFVKFEKMRVSYTQYSQHASDKYSSGSTTGGASILLENNVLSFDYLVDLGDSDSGLYGGAGLGLFRSYAKFDAFLNGGDYALASTFKSENVFDIGFILIGGAKKKIDNAFIGAEINYISKEIQHSKNASGSSDPDETDIGGMILMLTTGVTF
jgi:hypothetical protein